MSVITISEPDAPFGDSVISISLSLIFGFLAGGGASRDEVTNDS